MKLFIVTDARNRSEEMDRWRDGKTKKRTGVVYRVYGCLLKRTGTLKGEEPFMIRHLPLSGAATETVIVK